MFVEMTGFCAPKAGHSATEWEDAARFAECWQPGIARLMVADGATEAFDVIRWVTQLVEAFVPPIVHRCEESACIFDATPGLDAASMVAWVARMQQQWRATAPREFNSYYEMEKFRTCGAYATILGCEFDISSRIGQTAHWRAVSVGDTVLFHVREGRLVSYFPELRDDDFGNHPPVVHSDPQRLEQLHNTMVFAEGELYVGDQIFVATDALAHWLLTDHHRGAAGPWDLLSLVDEAGFLRLVDEQRAAGALKNDDVTLVRVLVVRRPSPVLVSP